MKKEPLNTELVRAVVGAAHVDLDKVKQMLEEEPDILHAMMNWGGGDWAFEVRGVSTKEGRSNWVTSDCR